MAKSFDGLFVAVYQILLLLRLTFSQTSLPSLCTKPDIWYPIENPELSNYPRIEFEAIMMEEWRNEILQGMDSIPKNRIHGALVAFGERAMPIVHGENPQDIPLVAAELGRGRVCVVASKQWLVGSGRGVDTIKQNLRNWVSKGRYQDEGTDVFLLSKTRDRIPQNTKIIMFTGGRCNKRMESDYLEFIENGGGLLYAYQAGALEISKGKNHNTMPLSGILLKAGIALTGKLIRGNKNYSTSAPDEPHNVFHQIQDSKQHINRLTLHGKRIASNLLRIPSEIIISEFSDHLTSLPHTYPEEFAEVIRDVQKGNKPDFHRAILYVINIMVDHRIHYAKSPVVSSFPGDFTEFPDLICGEVSLRGQYNEIYPTGYYLPAGKSLSLEITSENEDFRKWQVQIGAHKDNLHKYKKDKLTRLPIIFVRKEITEKEMKIYSAHGGLVYLMSSVEPTRINVRFENVVQAPYYNKTSPKAKRMWKESKDAPGLWADIAGENIVFTVPSSVVRDLEDPREMIDYWDEATSHQHDLRGTNPRRHKRQWVVADQQPVAGAMHAGYPIVTHMNITDEKHKNFIFNMEYLRQHGSWGLFHEIGHNMQRRAWTFEGTREVTNNIYTLYTCEMMSEAKAWINPWVEKKLDQCKKYLTSGANFSTWRKQSGMALATFLQLAHHFGWQSMKKFFRNYEALPLSEHPREDSKRIDQWIERYSTITGFNLCPMFDFWGFPINDDVRSQLSNLPPCLPDDEITQMAPHRYRRIIQKYGDKVITEISGFGAADTESVSSQEGSDFHGKSSKVRFKSGKNKQRGQRRAARGASSGSVSDEEDENSGEIDEEEEESDRGCDSDAEDDCPAE